MLAAADASLRDALEITPRSLRDAREGTGYRVQGDASLRDALEGGVTSGGVIGEEVAIWEVAISTEEGIEG